MVIGKTAVTQIPTFPARACIYYMGTYVHAVIDIEVIVKTVDASWKVKSQLQRFLARENVALAVPPVV